MALIIKNLRYKNSSGRIFDVRKVGRNLVSHALYLKDNLVEEKIFVGSLSEIHKFLAGLHQASLSWEEAKRKYLREMNE